MGRRGGPAGEEGTVNRGRPFGEGLAHDHTAQ